MAALFAGLSVYAHGMFFNQAFSVFPQVNGMFDDAKFYEGFRPVATRYLRNGLTNASTPPRTVLLSVRICGQTCCLPVIFAI